VAEGEAGEGCAEEGYGRVNEYGLFMPGRHVYMRKTERNGHYRVQKRWQEAMI
jgi:hypothetical protein